MMDTVYIWRAITLDGISESGISHSEKRSAVKRQLHSRGLYRISLEPLPWGSLLVPLNNRDLSYILDSLVSILDAGISIREALELLINDRRSAVIRYVFLDLRKSLHNGLSLEDAFSTLSPLFPEFFVAMIRLCEKSGQLRQGLHNLKTYYMHQEERRQDLLKIMRYPKIVFSTMVLLSLGLVVFVVPMFSSVYALFGDDLPFLTHAVVQVSRFLHVNQVGILICCFILVGWAFLPWARHLHPLVLLLRKVKSVVHSRDDPYLYAYAMSLLLESGQSVIQATSQATACMSLKNRAYGNLVTEKLNAGMGFSEAFQEIKWFPDLFLQFMKPAEQTGLLKVGFEQIHTYIDRERSARFEKWSRLIEPVLMLILGAVILVLLLAIYLPIFDLGNRIG